MSVHRDKGERWFRKYYVKEDGHSKEKRQYYGHGDIAQAQALKDDEASRKIKGKIDGGLTVTEVCQLYHTQHRVESTTASTDAYRLERIILPSLGHLQAETITSHNINQYVLARLNEGRKRKTVDRELDILRSAFSWAQSQDPPLITRNPISKYRIGGVDDSDVPFPPTQEEIQRIIAHAPPHLIRAIIIEWYCGMRPGGEVLRLKWQDVDLASGKLRVISAKKGGPAIRYVPIKTGAFKDHLVRWRTDDEISISKIGNVQDVAVVHYRLKPISSLKTSWSTAKRKAGITRRLRQYDLRHAMVTYALEHGADLGAVSQIIGHSRPDTTLRHYQHVLDSQRRDAVEGLPDLIILRDLE